jgi:hypothetical protein
MLVANVVSIKHHQNVLESSLYLLERYLEREGVYASIGVKMACTAASFSEPLFTTTPACRMQEFVPREIIPSTMS